jgi:hypothetical protein
MDSDYFQERKWGLDQIQFQYMRLLFQNHWWHYTLARQFLFHVVMLQLSELK